MAAHLRQRLPAQKPLRSSLRSGGTQVAALSIEEDGDPLQPIRLVMPMSHMTRLPGRTVVRQRPVIGESAFMTLEELIRRYALEPHPEGGWYREVHRSDQAVSRQDGQRRAALTTILFLLPRGEISRWHRVSRADETWHHAGGAALELLCLPPGGGTLRRQRLASLGAGGPADSAAQGDLRPRDVSAAEAAAFTENGCLDPSEPLAIVPAGWWQAARSLGAWSLVSCCVGPGFEFADFTLLRDLPAPEWPPGALPELV